MTETSMVAGESDRSTERKPVAVIAGALGVLACAVALVAARHLQWNVVTYASQPVRSPEYLIPTLFAACLLLLLPIGSIVAARRASAGISYALALLWPLLGATPLAIAAACGLSVPFFFSFLMIISCAVVAARVAAILPMRTPVKAGGRWAFVSLLLLIALALLL